MDPDVIELGSGDELVYGVYYPAYRTASTSWRFPMKIGSTSRSLEERLMRYRTALPEQLHVAIVIRCPNGQLLERTLQLILEYRGFWVEEAAGNEWYSTSPEEIKFLYEFLDSDFYDWGLEPVYP